MTAIGDPPPKAYVEAFGSEDARWDPDPSHGPEAVARAWAQHCVAVAVAGRLREHRMTRQELAGLLGQDRGGVYAKLRGDAWMTVPDLVALAILLGPDCGPTWPGAEGHLFPPEYEPWLHAWQPGTFAWPTFASPALLWSPDDWGAVLPQIQEALVNDSATGRAHHVDVALIRRWMLNALLATNLPPHELHLVTSDSVTAVQIGPSRGVVVGFVLRRDGEGGPELMHRLSDLVEDLRRLSELPFRRRFVCLVLGHLLGTVFREQLLGTEASPEGWRPLRMERLSDVSDHPASYFELDIRPMAAENSQLAPLELSVWELGKPLESL